MARHTIEIRLDQKGNAKEASIGSITIQFAHHDFEIQWSEETGRQEVVEGVNTFYGGIGEGESFKNWKDAMLCSLYDLYQVDNTFKDGDIFEVTYKGEKAEFQCDGVHVVER